MAVGKNETSSANTNSAAVVSGLDRVNELPPIAEGRASRPAGSSARRGRNQIQPRRAEDRRALPAWRPVNRSSGRSTTTHGRSKGKLLALAPVKSAAASSECHRSDGRRATQARQAKSKAARA